MKQSDLLSIIAHYELVLGTDKTVPGMEGFAKFYVSSMSPADKRLLNNYRKVKAQAAKYIADKLSAPELA